VGSDRVLAEYSFHAKKKWFFKKVDVKVFFFDMKS
jgi:hypothetical protein